MIFSILERQLQTPFHSVEKFRLRIFSNCSSIYSKIFPLARERQQIFLELFFSEILHHRFSQKYTFFSESCYIFIIHFSKNYIIFLISPLIGLYWIMRSCIIRQRAEVFLGKSPLDSNSRRTSTGADFNISFCLEQSKTIKGARFLKAVRLRIGSIFLP